MFKNINLYCKIYEWESLQQDSQFPQYSKLRPQYKQIFQIPENLRQCLNPDYLMYVSYNFITYLSNSNLIQLGFKSRDIIYTI